MEGPDAAYLKQSVGPPLMQALASMVTEQPVDAVEVRWPAALGFERRKMIT